MLGEGGYGQTYHWRPNSRPTRTRGLVGDMSGCSSSFSAVDIAGQGVRGG